MTEEARATATADDDDPETSEYACREATRYTIKSDNLGPYIVTLRSG